MRAQRIQPRLYVPRADALRRTDVLRDLHVRWIEQAAGVVLHVDDECVDLGRISEAHERCELAASERPGVHIQRLDRFGALRVFE